MESDDDATYTHFAHKEAFFSLFNKFLDCRLDLAEVGPEQSESEERLVESIGAILDHYLPLPTLLDPHLEAIIQPLFRLLREHLGKAVEEDNRRHSDRGVTSPTLNEARLGRVGKLINWVVKVRGRKAVVTHLPSEVHNLPLLLRLFSRSPTGTLYHPAISSATSWELRSVLLLWLSLLMTVPFNLSAFDESANSATPEVLSRTATRVQEVCHPLLYKPSKEGEYAALALARLYARPDCKFALKPFLSWIRSELDKQDIQDDGLEAIFLVNVLSFLAITPGLLPSDGLRAQLNDLRHFHQEALQPRFEKDNGVSATSSLLRKMAVKAEGRWWMVKLGTNRTTEKRAVKASTSEPSDSGDVLRSLDHRIWKREEVDQADDFAPPEGFEQEIESLLQNLSDKDTIVRYSAAKYIARVASVLPQELSTQIIEALIELFDGTEFEPVVETERGRILDPGGGSRGDARWHGVCLALAETARRGLIDEERLAEVLSWVIKALSFDIKRGAHSVGSNVRDAAAYLTWSLARASDSRSISPFTQDIAVKLVAVACFDREVGIRRAASAAYQEHVGRMGLFPHGIDVLRKTDFYSVSVRRTAFLTAAIEVAQHDEYRSALIDCLHYNTLRHWDPAIRLLAATSLKAMCNVKPEEDSARESIAIEIEHLRSVDTANVHGALAALTELASVYPSDDAILANILGSLQIVRPSAWLTFGSDLLLEAAANCIVAAACSALESAASTKASCMKIVQLGLQNKKESVQSAAAEAFGAISRHTDSGAAGGRMITRHGSVMAIGKAFFPRHKQQLQAALGVLFENVNTTRISPAEVEVRRASYDALVCLATNNDTSDLAGLMAVLYSGMDDYSTDQRGDVGSWIRVSCCRGIASLAIVNRGCLGGTSELTTSRLLKLAVEKLEVVRNAALTTLNALSSSLEVESRRWTEDLRARLARLANNKETQMVFSTLSPMLKYPEMRWPLLLGLITSIGSKNKDITTAARRSLLDTLQSSADPVLTSDVTVDLSDIAAKHFTQHRIFIPTMATTWELASADVWQDYLDEPVVEALRRLILLSAKGVPTLKNIERIMTAMKAMTSLLKVPAVRPTIIERIPCFLSHAYPRIRAVTAETLYLTLQELEIEDEELDEMLLNLDWNTDEAKASVGPLVDRLKAVL